MDRAVLEQIVMQGPVWHRHSCLCLGNVQCQMLKPANVTITPTRVLAAHEIRSRKGRESLFNEVRRIVAPQGRVVLVEHLRDFIAAITFGPGVFHFFPRREWIDLTCAAFELEQEFPITSFVRVFVLRPRMH